MPNNRALLWKLNRVLIRLLYVIEEYGEPRSEDMSDYHINLFYSDEDGGWIADIPNLFACSAFGDTPEEALREALIAKEAWLQAARQFGKPIPDPRYRPAVYRTI